MNQVLKVNPRRLVPILFCLEAFETGMVNKHPISLKLVHILLSMTSKISVFTN